MNAPDDAIIPSEVFMSHTISIEQASTQLSGLIHGLGPNDEIVLTENDKPVAKIVPNTAIRPRVAGTCKGMLEILDDSDDVILQEFKDYL